MKKYFTFSALTLAVYFLHAQINSGKPYSPTIFSNSPIAASLGQYNPASIDLFSGQPNISFNLFSFSREGYDLSLDLSYNLASIKPDILPTWTGAGWNLNAGGVITRSVNGGVDEVMVGMSGEPVPNRYSYYDNFNSLDNDQWDSTPALTDFINNNRSIGGGTRTAYPAPDEFNFNVNGMSGTFYKDHKGKWVIASGDFKDIKIEDELATDFSLYEDGRHAINSKTHKIKRIIYGFTLTDQKGIRYIFGKTPQSIEFSATPYITPTDPYNPHFIANSWFLTKVILPSNFEITFNYLREDKALFKMHHTFASMDYKVDNVTAGGQQKITKNPERTFVVYPKDININNIYTIEFLKSTANVAQYNFTDISNTQWNSSFGYDYHFRGDIMAAKQFYKLDKISIKKDSVIEEVSFSYLEDPAKKLFLTGFNRNGQSYQLEYYSTDLPGFNLMKNDHWGYFNNKTYLGTVTPANGTKYSLDQMKNVLPAYKETDPAQLTLGVLKKIIYPTKGSNEFVYEPHDYSKVIDVQNTAPYEFVLESSVNKIAGGLRIKKTITAPGDGQNIVKEYFYTDTGITTGASSGILSAKPVHFEEDRNSTAHEYRFADMPVLQDNNTKGKHVVYSKVTERVGGTDLGGTTEYVFSNSDNGFIDKRANTIAFISFGNQATYNTLRHLKYNSLESERGKPLSVTKKDKDGKIVQKTTYKYNDAPARFNSTVRAYDFQDNVYGEPISHGAFTQLNGMAELIRLSAYNIYSYNPYLSEKQDVYYKDNVPSVTETTKYAYGSSQHNQLTSLVFTDTTGSLTTSSFSYAHEKGNQLMIAKNMIGIPLETINTKTEGTVSKTLSKTGTTYPLNQTEANTKTAGFVLPTSVLSYDLQNSNSSFAEITYDKYDLKGNLQQYTTKEGIPVSVIWGYNNTQPIAKIEGALLSEIPQALITEIVTASDTDAAAVTNSDETALLLALDNFRKHSSLSAFQVTTYTYDLLVGVRSITPPSGVRELYLYDTANRLEKVVDVNGNMLKEIKYNYKN
ncbi:hypothetical protein DRF59_20560 [Chryseobacterium flavum]|uniref:RHS repeat protein n=1 Tax=Chryseobacterium flavum TaxID=415851 RepID=A0A3D9CFT1_9FLAO|nr:hypothetical protein [Chryseobacterium flavum]REC64522.1 hypothetical protein DRF59_20560 [Chryseobacterium flavum]